MKNKLQLWTEEMAQEARLLSAELRWAAGKLHRAVEKRYRKGKDAVSAPEPPETTAQPAPQPPDPMQLRQELTEDLERAIRRGYYREGGFQFFGDSLLRYVKVVLPRETEYSRMWAAGYNSCIQPMLRQLEKLEREMTVIRAGCNQEPLPLQNEGLLKAMQHFRHRAMEEGLQMQEGREAEDYRRCLQQYAGELDSQLLTPYRLPGEE